MDRCTLLYARTDIRRVKKNQEELEAGKGKLATRDIIFSSRPKMSVAYSRNGEKAKLRK